MNNILETLSTYRVGTFVFFALELILVVAVVTNWDTLSTVAVWGEGYDVPNVANYLALVFGSLILIPTAMLADDLANTYLL